MLCGFMGSGKTTIFKRLMENSPKVSGFDLDDLVQEKISLDGEDLGQAIERVGFEEFRLVERALLIEKLKEQGNVLISLGGGSLSPEVLEIISKDQDIKLIWLKTDFETCWERISGSKNRPLVKKGKDFLKKLFLERESIYCSADIVLNIEAQQRITCFEELDDECQVKA